MSMDRDKIRREAVRRAEEQSQRDGTSHAERAIERAKQGQKAPSATQRGKRRGDDPDMPPR